MEQIIGGRIIAKDVAEKVFNEDTKELETRGWVMLTIVNPKANELVDFDKFDEADSTPDSFTVRVLENDSAFKRLCKAEVVPGATIKMKVTSATRSAAGFENLVIGPIAIDTKCAEPEFYKAPVYVDVIQTVTTKRKIHRF